MRILFVLLSFFISLNAFAEASFSDEDSIPAWAWNPINTLVEQNILSGNSDGSFAPLRQMNRAEFCKILANATGVDMYLPLTSHFPDVKRDDWFFDYAETALYYGWIEGYPDGTFRPGNKINRAEVAKIIVNAFDLEIPSGVSGEEWFMPYFQALDNNNLLAYNSDIDNLSPSVNPTRAEISQQIFRVMQYTGKIATDSSQESTQTSSVSSSTQTQTLASDDYSETNSVQTVTTESSAGTLQISKNSSLAQKVTVSKGQNNVSALSLKLYSQNGLTELSGLQFRKIGNGPYTNFSEIWLEQSGKEISAKIKPTADLMYIPLSSILTIGSSEKTLTLKVNISGTATSSSTRWTLFLPEWINSNTSKKIGFFPFGGSDMDIK